MSYKYWSAGKVYDPAEINSISKELGLSVFILDLLAQRGYREKAEIIDFLYPKLSNIPDPLLISNMSAAAELVCSFLQKDKKIVIWGDYDVDGTTSIALLVHFFDQLGKSVQYVVPNRLKEGYGLNNKSIDKICLTNNPNQTLIITVDCGISDRNEIKHAKEKGFAVLVTDHHEIPNEKSKADVVVNPKNSASDKQCKDLAGVGVAFYLTIAVRALLRKNNYFAQKGIDEPNLKELLSLVALGTVADMVPLVGLNRILVSAGLEALSVEKSNYGLIEILRSNFIKQECITTEDINFKIAPMINAAGRLGVAEQAVDLLLEYDEERAKKLAKNLLKLNEKRQQITVENTETALSKFCNNSISQGKPLVQYGDYHFGVLGIVASKVSEKYKCPVLLLAKDFDDKGLPVLKGSARSIEGVNLYKALDGCKPNLIRFGGHKMAAGMMLYEKDFDKFKINFEEQIKQQRNNSKIEEVGEVSMQIQLDTVLTDGFTKDVSMLEPFGVGNPQPIFQDKCALIQKVSAVGKEKKHLKIIFRGKFKNHNSIGFGMGEKIKGLCGGREVNVIYTISLNRFRNQSNWEPRLLHIAR